MGRAHAGAVIWLPLDLLLVSAFAVIGRLSHDEALTLSGWWQTAWPFLAGTLVGWAVVAATRRPVASVPAGLLIWASTAVGGLLLRHLSGQGTAAPFVVVATLVLGLVLVVPRLAFLVLRRTPPVA
jgi:hypothetical protein